VLINNAGAQFTNKRETTVDGHEKTMTINVFAPHLLTLLLLPLLQKSPSARVVTVSSAAHKMAGKPNLDDIELKQKYSMSKAYGLSKLYIIWIMRHFVSEMEKAGIHNIAFYTVHPGSAQSSLGRESTKSSLVTRIIYFLWKPLMNSVAAGAAPSIKAATSPELESVTGKYFGPKGEEKPSDKYYSKENEQKVWDYSMNVIKPYL
jgi:NAD(P)-dependent dehydrogenase (short-subunit alcohol dehydrogenase family)